MIWQNFQLALVLLVSGPSFSAEGYTHDTAISENKKSEIGLSYVWMNGVFYDLAEIVNSG